MAPRHDAVARDSTGSDSARSDSARLYRMLVESVRDYAIFAIDPDGYVLTWNAGAARLKGYRGDEIIGQHFSRFYTAERVAEGFPQYELEVAQRDGRFEDEGWRVRKDGTHFWANVVITALRDVDGQLMGFAKVTRDLTERRAAQERAILDARRLAEVEAGSRARSEFLTAMSHELRTPINATLGYLELIELGIGGTGGATPPRQQDYLRRIRGSQQHLLRIVTDLLDYGRIEAGRIAYDRAPVSLGGVIRTVLPMIEPQAAAKGLVLDGDGVGTPDRSDDRSDDAIALGDRGRIEQIVLNLLSNAVKFTPPGGRVVVRCLVTEERAVVAVDDTGPGVPASEQEAIFEPFVQLGRTLTSGHEGTGLGLAISREMARGMGGELEVESGTGSGATFRLVLARG